MDVPTADTLSARPDVEMETRDDGTRILRSRRTRLATPERAWASCSDRVPRTPPIRVMLAERDGAGGWRKVTWAEAAKRAASIGQALLDRRLGPERPLMILSGNSVDDALMTLGALWAGVPVSPVSAAYSLMSRDFAKLRHIYAQVKPGLVFADRGTVFAAAFQALGDRRVELVVSDAAPVGRRATLPAKLLNTPPQEGRPGRGAGGSRDHRQDPVHLGFHRRAQGRHQHPRDAHGQPAGHRPVLAIPRGDPAGAGGLAALEPHLRGQPQLQHGASPRRHFVRRRGQAGAGPGRGDGGECPGGLADDLLQRARRLRQRCSRSWSATPSCASASSPGCRCSSTPRRRSPTTCGSASTAWPARPWATRWSSPRPGAPPRPRRWPPAPTSTWSTRGTSACRRRGRRSSSSPTAPSRSCG